MTAVWASALGGTRLGYRIKVPVEKKGEKKGREKRTPTNLSMTVKFMGVLFFPSFFSPFFPVKYGCPFFVTAQN